MDMQIFHSPPPAPLRIETQTEQEAVHEIEPIAIVCC